MLSRRTPGNCIRYLSERIYPGQGGQRGRQHDWNGNRSIRLLRDLDRLYFVMQSSIRRGLASVQVENLLKARSLQIPTLWQPTLLAPSPIPRSIGG